MLYCDRAPPPGNASTLVHISRAAAVNYLPTPPFLLLLQPFLYLPYQFRYSFTFLNGFYILFFLWLLFHLFPSYLSLPLSAFLLNVSHLYSSVFQSSHYFPPPQSHFLLFLFLFVQ